MNPEIQKLLQREAARINSPEFIALDPVQFPRRYADRADIEIVSLLAAHMAWGNRKMICRDIERLLEQMTPHPARWVRNGAYESIPDRLNIHRTFFGSNLKHMLRGFEAILAEYPTIDDWAQTLNLKGKADAPWLLADALNQELRRANGRDDSRCFPLNLKVSALKRLNMALRWLVRRDGIVDMGLWHSLDPGDLYIPLDVHVGNVARSLGLTQRKANDRKTAAEITAALRLINPADPALFDFALFGLGVEGALTKENELFECPKG